MDGLVGCSSIARLQNPRLQMKVPPPNVTISVDPPQPSEGEEVKLECWSASSNPAARIFWWRDGRLLPEHQVQTEDGRHGGSVTRSRLRLPVSSAEDGIRFTCEAKNDAFQQSAREQVTLRVLYAPEFMSLTDVHDLVEGRSGHLNATARGNPPVSRYAWSKDGVGVIPNKPEDFRQMPRVSADGAVLYFTRVSRHDAGAYTCVAQNSQGSASATMTLNVLYPASVLNISGATEVPEGDTTNIECSAEGNPMTENTVTWRTRDDKRPLPYLIPHLDRSILSMPNVTRMDGGDVECVADNALGKPSVKSTRLVIMYRPIILKDQLKRRIASTEKEDSQLTCGSEGHPSVSFIWSFNGSTIATDSTKYQVQHFRKNDGNWWSNLVVRGLDTGDYGIYTCIASNSLGHDFMAFTLSKTGIPEPPDNLEASNTSHDSVLISWRPGFDGGLSQSFQIRFRPGNPEDQNYSFVDVPSNTTSFLVCGLQQGMEYELSVASRNALGQSAFASTLKLRTKKLPFMDSTVSGPSTQGEGSSSLLPGWLLAAAVIGSLVVLANILFCVIYVRKKRWCHGTPEGPANVDTDDISREKIVKKIPCPTEDQPFYLTGKTVHIADDTLDISSFQKDPSVVQVSRESSDDGQSSGRRCDCGGRQWGTTLLCGGKSPGHERTDNQHEQCPDILKRDSCHCHSSGPPTMVPSELDEMSPTLGAVMYGQKDAELTKTLDYQHDQLSPSPPPITLTTFQSKSELPIRHSLLEKSPVKLETVINGDSGDS